MAKKKTVVKKAAETRARTSPAKKASTKKAGAKAASAAKKASAKKAPATKIKLSPAKGKRSAPMTAKAKAGASSVGEGAVAPGFELPDQDGKLVSSASLKGKPYVLYFYPKDDTPGCTKEACDFRDFGVKFGARGARILGVSPDSTASHAKFRAKYGLPFTLLSDAEKELAQAYGVWVKKKNYGREYMGIERSTFLIDAQGKIKKAWRGVRVPGHVESVLAEL